MLAYILLVIVSLCIYQRSQRTLQTIYGKNYSYIVSKFDEKWWFNENFEVSRSNLESLDKLNTKLVALSRGLLGSHYIIIYEGRELFYHINCVLTDGKRKLYTPTDIKIYMNDVI